MDVLMIIRVAFRALLRNKMRAALTMLGIIIGVSAVIAMVSIGQGASASVQAQIESIGTNLLFVSAQYPEIRKWTVQSGDFLTAADVITADRVIVIGQTIANNLFPGAEPVGQTVRLQNLSFRVVGVMAKKGQDQQGRDQDDVAFAPYTTVQKKVLGSPRLQVAYVSAVSQDATYTAPAQITELLRQRHKLAANDPDDFTVRNMTDIA